MLFSCTSSRISTRSQPDDPKLGETSSDEQLCAGKFHVDVGVRGQIELCLRQPLLTAKHQPGALTKPQFAYKIRFLHHFNILNFYVIFCAGSATPSLPGGKARSSAAKKRKGKKKDDSFCTELPQQSRRVHVHVCVCVQVCTRTSTNMSSLCERMRTCDGAAQPAGRSECKTGH